MIRVISKIFCVSCIFMNSSVVVKFRLNACSWGSCDFCCKQIIAILLEKYFCSDYYRGSILQLLTVPEQALCSSIKRTRGFKYGKEDIDVYSFKLWQGKYDWFIPDILHNKLKEHCKLELFDLCKVCATLQAQMLFLYSKFCLAVLWSSFLRDIVGLSVSFKIFS